MTTWLVSTLNIELWQVACVLLAFIIGGAAKGALGFGLPFVTVSIIPLFAPLDIALAVNAIVLPIANFLQFTQSGRIKPTLKRFHRVVIGLVAGVPLGAYLLSLLNIHWVELILGIFVMGFVAITILNPSLRVVPDRERTLGLAVGFAAGVIGTMTTVNGPFFIMYLLGLRVERQEMLAALGLLFIVSGLCFAVFFSWFGILTVERAVFGVACAAFAMAGMGLGDWSVKYIDREFFRKLVLGGLFVLGLNIFLRGLG